MQIDESRRLDGLPYFQVERTDLVKTPDGYLTDDPEGNRIFIEQRRNRGNGSNRYWYAWNAAGEEGENIFPTLDTCLDDLNGFIDEEYEFYGESVGEDIHREEAPSRAAKPPVPAMPSPGACAKPIKR